jgi:hypothetical protein
MKSTGLGDSIAKFTHALKIDKLAEAVAAIAGAPGCGCKERKEYLNKLFPYDTSTIKVRILVTVGVKDHKDQTDHNYPKGTIVDVDKSHPLYPHLLGMAQSKHLEEIE